MKIIDKVYDLIWPPENIGEQIERDLLREVRGRTFWVHIKGDKSTYTIRKHPFSNHVEWEDDIAEEEHRKRVNWRPALDKDGNHEFHYGLPFGGEFIGTPADKESAKALSTPRKYYHWKCDAIPLMIRSPRYLDSAPLDLIEALIEQWDEIIPIIKEQEIERIKCGV